jgi:hypothetical protein
MIRHHLLEVEWILLHAHKVLHVAELALHDAIVVRCPIELWADELFHQFAGFGCVVSLLGLS